MELKKMETLVTFTLAGRSTGILGYLGEGGGLFH